MTKLLGITGRKRSGKDTLAHIVKGIDSEFVITHFADPLKTFCCDVFGLSMKYFVDQDWKESILTPINIDDYLPKLKKVSKLKDIPALGLIAETPRKLMQYVGTEYIRSADNEYWLKKMLTFMNQHAKVIIADARYPNEFEFIKKYGTLVKVVRMSQQMSVTADTHSSEAFVDDSVTDITLACYEGKFEPMIEFSLEYCDE